MLAFVMEWTPIGINGILNLKLLPTDSGAPPILCVRACKHKNLILLRLCCFRSTGTQHIVATLITVNYSIYG
jgi:hypothetical protein